MTKRKKFSTDLHSSEFARDLQRRAVERGLYVSLDKWGGHHLQLHPDAIKKRKEQNKKPGVMDTNPYLILTCVTIDEIEKYLAEHKGEHRFLGPAEVYGYIRGSADDD